MVNRMPEKTAPKPSRMAGHVTTCPDCRKSTLAWTDALQASVPTPGQLVILKGLTGHKCSNCGLETLDLASAAALEREQAHAVPANYEVAVVRQHDRRGVFLTKDLVRLTHADEASTALITPIDENHLLIELKKGDA